MEKLLFMGVEPSTELALTYAKKSGVYTIISDFKSKDSDPIKKKADEVWKIDVGDVKTLEAACRKSGIAGVYASSNEFCLSKSKELSERLFGSFYIPEEMWRCATDKTRFKSQCIRAGLDVPQIYEITYPLIPEQYSKLPFPLVIKPSDSNASQGLTICRNPSEFEKAYEYALKYSSSKKIVVEDYIEGNECMLEFCFYEGRAYQTAFSHLYKQQNDERLVTEIPVHRADTDYYREYKETIYEKVMKLFQNMHCHNGVGFIQVIYQNHVFYFLEFACRLDGVGSWATEKMLRPYSRVDFLVDLSLHRDLKKWEKRIAALTDFCRFNGAEYMIPLKPGRVVAVEGLDIVRKMERVTVVLERFHEGDFSGDSKSMYQFAYYIALGARSLNETKDMIKAINNTLHIYDENGREMLDKLQDFEILA